MPLLRKWWLFPTAKAVALKQDVTITKNYLSEKELLALNSQHNRLKIMTAFSPFSRYHGIINDIPAFENALLHLPRRSFWTNTLRIDPVQLAAVLRADGYNCTSLPWPGGFRLPDNGSGLGQHWAYLAGLFNIQEASAMLPALILAPHPGDRVLDLCAAPGNKTAQLAVAMQNRGTVVANDPDYRRLQPVRMMIDRLGLINVSTTCRDGTTFPHPQDADRFDCVLVDAPCSCEGTVRKNPKVRSRRAIPREKISRKQTALLERAVQLCRPGGRIVYSTCTFAPEENEAVVHAVLRNCPNQLRVLPVRQPGLKASPGLTTWAGQTFHSELRHCLRIWPHHNDTDGFFIALLEKTDIHPATASFTAIPENDGAARSPSESTPKPVANLAIYLHYLQTRFGISDAVFESVRFSIKRDRDIRAIAEDHRPPLKPFPSMGIPFMHIGGRFFKLTTAAAMLYGHHAHRNIISVSLTQLNEYLSRQTITLDRTQASRCTGNGHVLIRYENRVFGIGFYRLETSTVESLYPKSMAISLHRHHKSPTF